MSLIDTEGLNLLRKLDRFSCCLYADVSRESLKLEVADGICKVKLGAKLDDRY